LAKQEEFINHGETPLGKVMDVIDKIRHEVVKEGVNEEDIYDNFACFCKDKTARLEKHVKFHAGKIDLSSSNIADWTARTNELQAENLERSSNHEKWHAQMDDTERQLKEESANWQNTDNQFTANKRLITQALNAMEDSRDRINLLQVPGISHYVAIADAMGLQIPTKHKALATSLLQGAHEDGNPALLQGASKADGTHKNPMESYEYHGGSNDIIDLVQSLMTQMQGLHKDQLEQHEKAVNSFKDMIRALDRKIRSSKEALSSNIRSIATMKKDTAEARAVLIENNGDLEETEHVLKEVTSACQARAKEYDERSSNRKKELEALTTALACLRNARPAADSQRLGAGAWEALMQATPGAAPKALPMPNNTASSKNAAKVKATNGKAIEAAVAKPHSFIQETSEQSHDERKKRALAVILDAGQKANSVMLTSLAATFDRDPFEKVKKLLTDLRFRLEAEASQETNKKVFCDEELKKSRHERDTRFEEAQHINVLIMRLDARKDTLKQTIKMNQDKATELASSIKTVFTDASELNAEQLERFNKQKEARDELKEAIRILRTYYSGAAKAGNTGLLQVLQDQDADPLNAAYRSERRDINKEANQRKKAHEVRKADWKERERKRIGDLDGDVPAAGRVGTLGDALALLETVASDFDREIGNLEGDMSKEYKELVRVNNALKAQKIHAEELVQLDTQELNTVTVTTNQKYEDLKTTQNLLDDALRELEELKPMCIDTGMSYSERVKMRETEMEALRKALCILGETDEKYDCKD